MASPNNCCIPDCKQTKRGTQSTRRHLPLFRKVVKADQYAPACHSVYVLAGELLKRGQTTETVTHDLAGLVSISTRALEPLQVAEIVMAAHFIRSQEGGAQ